MAVVAGELLAIQTGIFGSTKREWPCEEVKSIESGSSGMEVNKVPILELQITGTDDIKFGLLAGRAEEEIEWLAYTLRGTVFPPHSNPTKIARQLATRTNLPHSIAFIASIIYNFGEQLAVPS